MNDSSNIHLIIYLSCYIPSGKGVEVDLREIGAAAQRRNPGAGIYGALFFHENRFLQAIEGPQPALEALMATLEEDPRHCDLVRVVDEPVERRSFEEWNMQTFDLSPREELSLEMVENFRCRFLEQGPLEGRVFVDLLKKFCSRPALRQALVVT
ncbi:BLUF domain-containing protein [Roseibacillus ishigakijimensis]|uniref:BLUF domain-containing protein n=1 Tax=Roseibacillus ishigakijimensis TaxID=454146 RepID=A0A934RTY1_9BACT|nr:BLUF domain-containing protein [Roseibacillus ishigakijimensis]MBK1834105.1 BLUF domain-containing protein [Roseibacillus ishigakijimensis]